MPYLRPILWWSNLLLLAAVFYGAAAVGSQMLRQKLEASMPSEMASTQLQQAAAPRERIPLGAFQPILDANIFHARRTILQPQGDMRPAAAAPNTAPSDATLPVSLKGTFVMGRNSFAMVADSAGRNEQLYRLTECLPAATQPPPKECQPNQGKLEQVLGTSIKVQYQGRLLTIEMGQDSTPTAPQAAQAVASRPNPRRANLPGRNKGADAGDDAAGAGGTFPMQQDGNNFNFNVPSAEVEKAFENFSDILKQARVVPFKSEDVEGFQIRNIRPNSIFQRIGLENFDVIRSVNGEDVNSSDQALRLITAFRNERQINLKVTRRDEDIDLNYTIE